MHNCTERSSRQTELQNFPPEQVARDARVVVICVARIGDTLLSTPVLQAIKDACPDGEVTCLAHPKRLEILQGLSCVDRLAGITKKTAWLRGRFGAKRWDYALLYGRDDELVEFAFRTARRVIGFARADRQGPGRPFHITVAPPAKITHAVDERLMLPEALGIHAQSKRLLYRISDQEMDVASNWIRRRIGSEGKRLIGLQFASFPTKAYRDWPVDNVTALCNRILDRYDDVKLLCLGGPADARKGKVVAAALGTRCKNIAGELSLRESSAVMARLSLYIGVDTGPTHVAGALGIPMVALYHCRHRGRHLAPLEHPAPLVVVEHPQSDEGCSTETLMSDISVDAVWEAVHRTLDDLRRTSRSRDMSTDHVQAQSLST
jgi:heptosyltransferase III